MRRMELDGVILRWKKTTRALKIQDQEYGRHLTDVLDRVTDEQLVHFRDPVEAAAFFCLLDLLKKIRMRTPADGEPGGSAPFAAGCSAGQPGAVNGSQQCLVTGGRTVNHGSGAGRKASPGQGGT